MKNRKAITILGCLVAVLSSAMQAIGITLQRKSFVLRNQNRELPSNQHKYTKDMWVHGFILFIFANVFGSVVQFATLPLIILSPLQSSGLIFSSLMGCAFLPDQRFTALLCVGTAATSIGAFIIAYNGDLVPADQDGNLEQQLKEISKRLKDGSFLMWLAVTFILMLMLLLANYVIFVRKRHLAKQRRKLRLWQEALLGRYLLYQGIIYGLISGTLTAHTFLFAKSFVKAIGLILEKGEGFSSLFQRENIITLILLVVMLIIIGLQLSAINSGLTHMRSSVFYPLCFLVFNLVNLCDELNFDKLLSQNLMTIRQLIMVLVGLLCVFFGVLLVSRDGSCKAFDSTDSEVFVLTNDLFAGSEIVSFEREQLKKLVGL